MRIALTLLFLPLLGGCPTLFDGKLDCPIGTKACLDLAASYDADPAAVWARVERANNALRLGSAVLCASTGACVPLQLFLHTRLSRAAPLRSPPDECGTRPRFHS